MFSFRNGYCNNDNNPCEYNIKYDNAIVYHDGTRQDQKRWVWTVRFVRQPQLS